MKRAFLLVFGLILFISSCLDEDKKLVESEKELLFTAYLNDEVATKSERQDNTDVYWCPGDMISIFFNRGDHGGNRFVAQNVENAAIADFKGTITSIAGGGESTGGEFWFWGVYPYSEDNSCDGTSITLTLPAQQTGKAGSFANGLFPTMARAKGLELGFYNICGGLKFTVSRDDIKVIKFRGNANESLAGKAKVAWDSNGHPTIVEHLAGNKEVSVTAPNNGTFIPGTEYYIVFFPELLSEGFTITFITSESKQGVFCYGNSRQLKRGIFIDAPNVDTYVTSWTDIEDPTGQELNESEGGTESGLYLGMSTFERNLTYYQTHLISEETLESYNGIVDNLQLTSLNGTALYYSIDEDITSMQSITLPSDLFNVSIVTFTDGLDEGSLSYRRGIYKTKAEYLEALHSRLRNEKVSGLPIKSYAIGLKGPDATSNLTEFRNNLEKIASTPENDNDQYVYEISDINELNSSFESIAQQLSQNIRVQKVVVTIPFPEDGERKRFTLDNKSPEQSKLYIEGVVDLDNLQLVDVEYHGLYSTSGTTVPISEDYGFDLEFTFEGIQTNDGSEIVQDDIQLWYISASGSNWQRNSEFLPSQNSSVYTELKSAMVLLNLDLSKSLEGQLATLQTGVKSFLSMLYSSSVDPSIVKTARLNVAELELKVGQSETLQVSVSPSTASPDNLRWSSAIPSVATVDQNGQVTGVSEGTTIVTVSTENGKELASCIVQVSFQHVESVVLSRSELSMFVGKTATLISSVTPFDASNSSVIWSSSNTSVATVNSSGVVTAKALGTTNVTATSIDGSKTATCAITVTEFQPSSQPIDLSLTVWFKPNNDNPYVGYVSYEDLSYLRENQYEIIGLAVLSNSENFVVSMENASLQEMNHDASAYYNMPTKSQCTIISSRLTEINNALQQFGGDPISNGTWSKGYYTNQQNVILYYYIYGSGGSLSSDYHDEHHFVREVLSVDDVTLDCFVTKTKGIQYTYMDNNERKFVSNPDEIPFGCSVEGLAINSSTGLGRIIIDVKDASISPMTWSAASSTFGASNLPTKQQLQLISARLNEVNDALRKCGGDEIGVYIDGVGWKNYWSCDSYYDSYYNIRYYWYIDRAGGCYLSRDYDSEVKFVRLVKGTF